VRRASNFKIIRFARVIFESETNRALVTREDKPTVRCASRPQEPSDVPAGAYESVSLVQSRSAQVTVFYIPPVRYTSDAESKSDFFILVYVRQLMHLFIGHREH
jgi:hypothetical protein